MSHHRQSFLQSIFQCCSSQQIENSLLDQERNPNSYTKTSLKQKKKNTTTDSKISTSSSQRCKQIPIRIVKYKEITSQTPIAFGKQQYCQRAYQQVCKQNPENHQQKIKFTTKSALVHSSSSTNMGSNALRMRMPQNSAKQLKISTVQIAQKPLQYCESSSEELRESPTFPGLQQSLSTSRIVQPSQSALRIIEESDQHQHNKKFFSQIKKSGVTNDESQQRFQSTISNPVSDLPPRRFTRGSLIEHMRKTETLASRGSESLGSEVLENMQSMTKKMKDQ